MNPAIHGDVPPPDTADDSLLRDAESRYRDLAMACDQAVVVYAQGTIMFANDAAMDLLGATQRDQVVGLPVDQFFSLSDGAALVRNRTVAAGYAAASVAPLDKDEIANVTLMLIACRFAGKDAFQILVRDRRAGQTLEGRVSYLARNDVLTDLPNRTEFRERLIDALACAKQTQRQVAVIRLNVDFFRAVNEKHGDETGDAVLQEIASRIRQSIRPSDTVARVADHGFAVILEALEHRAQSSVVINRILAALKPPIAVARQSIAVGASAGIAAYPGDALEIDALLHAAETALYSARTHARGGFRFYFPEMQASSNRDEARRDEKARRAALLTHREREVMYAVVEGQSTKIIAHLLGTSPRTIESQRAQVMEKMGAESLVDLVRIVMDLRKNS